jgi:hypothetical protein
VVRDHVRTYVICQQIKVEQLQLDDGLLQPLEVPSTIWAYNHGFCRGIPLHQRQIGHPGGGRSILQVHPFLIWADSHGFRRGIPLHQWQINHLGGGRSIL